MARSQRDPCVCASIETARASCTWADPTGCCSWPIRKKPLLLKGGRFCLRRDIVDRGEIPAAQAAFRDYYVAQWPQADRRQRVKYFAPKVGVTPRKVDVRELGHRWASCSPNGNLAFHWKCMMAPPTIIDYIVVHELCHFHHLRPHRCVLERGGQGDP